MNMNYWTDNKAKEVLLDLIVRDASVQFRPEAMSGIKAKEIIREALRAAWILGRDSQYSIIENDGGSAAKPPPPPMTFEVEGEA